MCGIVGAIAKNQNLPLEKMRDVMDYRGPDDNGFWRGKSGDFFVYLGHRRLSIIDLSFAGHQPMEVRIANREAQKNDLWIVFNGEIYNFQEIKKELEGFGYQFRSRTDTEIILGAYDKWGIDCLKKFNGMFAFGIWDDNDKKLFLARDLSGQKPLYWTSLPDGGIIFSSEVKGILGSSQIKPEVNFEAIPGYLAFLRVHAPYTMFKNIYKLESGSYLVWKDGKIEQRVWWSPVLENPKSEIPNPKQIQNSKFKIQNLEDELEHLLIKSIERHMIADVPVGAFLSGGLDSSLIVAMASKFTKKPLKTFSIGFSAADRKKEGARKDELAMAKMVKKNLGSKIDYNEIIIEPNVLELLPEVAWHIDDPVCDPAAINAYLICKAAKENGATVLLSGMGGDEVFGGYNHYLAGWYIRYIDKLLAISRPLFNSMKFLFLALPDFESTPFYPYIRYLKRKGKFLDQGPDFRYIGMSSWLMPDEVSMMLSPDLNYDYKKLWESKLYHFRQFPKKDLLWRMMYTDFKTFLADHNLTYTDRMSMAVSCEVRSPLLDLSLVEFMSALPPEFKIRNFITKYLLKKTAEKYLPKEIIYQKKSGFAVPIKAWFNDLKPLLDDLLSSEALNKNGYFNAKTAQNMIKDTLDGKGDYSYRIWALLIFQMWHKNFIEKNF